jgi:hypothetical protein
VYGGLEGSAIYLVLDTKVKGVLGLQMSPRDTTAERILARLSDIENNPYETIRPYLEFNVDGNLYYFTPGGFLYRREPGTQEVGGFFCGYLSDEVWHYRTDGHYYVDEDSQTADEGGGEEVVRRNALSLVIIGGLIIIILLIVLTQLI